MINWTDLILTNRKAVTKFATGTMTGEDFQREFSGNPNPARFAVRNNGVTYARRLARKALRRRDLLA